MAASSPVAIPAPSHRTRGLGTPERQFSTKTGRSGRPLDDIPHGSPFSPSITESCCAEFESPQTASVLSPGSDLVEGHDCHPFSPPASRLRRSSSANSSLSSSTSRWTRAFSPPREPATGNDPLCVFEDGEESDDDSTLKTESATRREGDSPHISAKRQYPPRRQSQFKSNLTASLQALRDKLPSSIPSPALYSPPLLRPGERSYSLPPLPHALPAPLCSSLPIFDSLPHEAPVSSAIHLQTYSVSLGPPRKPREVRINSDFFRLLALEMEMRRSGKFVPPVPEIESAVQGIIVSGKVRMTLPRRSDKERDDINLSPFNKSRLKW